MKFIVSSMLSLIFLTFAHAESSSPSKGIIATSNPHASKAAKDIIDRGGNAIDATVAVQLVLTLTEPQATGIGGGAFGAKKAKVSGPETKNKIIRYLLQVRDFSSSIVPACHL